MGRTIPLLMQHRYCLTGEPYGWPAFPSLFSRSAYRHFSSTTRHGLTSHLQYWILLFIRRTNLRRCLLTIAHTEHYGAAGFLPCPAIPGRVTYHAMVRRASPTAGRLRWRWRDAALPHNMWRCRTRRTGWDATSLPLFVKTLPDAPARASISYNAVGRTRTVGSGDLPSTFRHLAACYLMPARDERSPAAYRLGGSRGGLPVTPPLLAHLPPAVLPTNKFTLPRRTGTRRFPAEPPAGCSGYHYLPVTASWQSRGLFGATSLLALHRPFLLASSTRPERFAVPRRKQLRGFERLATVDGLPSRTNTGATACSLYLAALISLPHQGVNDYLARSPRLCLSPAL